MDKKICPKCGAELPQAASLCPDCMTSLNERVTPHPPGGKKPFWPWLLAAVILIAAALALLLPREGAEPRTAAPPSPVVSPSPVISPSPAAAQTPDVSAAEPAPANETQLYAYEEHRTFLSNPAGGGRTLDLFVGDGAGGFRPVDESWTVYCDENLGELFWDAEVAAFFWTDEYAAPGERGLLCAEKDGVVYTLEGGIGMAAVGAYSVLPGDAAEGYIGGQNSDWQTEYVPGEEATVYLVVGESFDWSFSEWSSSNDAVAVAPYGDDGRTLAVTLAAGQSGRVASSLCFGAGGNVWLNALTFSPAA